MANSGAEPGTMTDVAHYAPVRVFLAGLRYVLFGGIALAMPILIGYLAFRSMTIQSDDAELAEAMPGLLVASAVCSLFGLLTLPKGVGLVCSAFARNCHLRAGLDGIAVRYPVQGWLGLYHVRAFQFAWDAIEKPVHHTVRILGIPVGHELRIENRKGGRLRIERHYFSESGATIQRRLLEIRTRWVEAVRRTALRREALSLLERAQRHETAQNLEAAAEAATAATKLEPHSAEAHQWLGYFLFQLGNYVDAGRAFRAAADIEPDNALYHYSYGRALLQDGNLAVAEMAFRRAIVLDPDGPDARISLGLTLIGLQDFEGARAELATLETLDAERAEELRRELPPT